MTQTRHRRGHHFGKTTVVLMTKKDGFVGSNWKSRCKLLILGLTDEENQRSKHIYLFSQIQNSAALVDGKLFDSQFSSWSAAVQLAPCETCKV